MAQGSHVCSGPTSGAALNWTIRRVVAVTATLSLLALGFTVPPTSATITAAAPGSGAAAAFVSFDYEAEARALDATARATRKARADAAVKTGLGSVEVAAPPVKVATATKKTSKKPAKVTKQAPTKKKADTQAAGRKPAAAKKPGKATSAGKKPATVAASGSVAEVVRFALSQVGDRYVYGATGPDRWDCSALSMAAYAQIGIRLPHQSGQQMRYGRAISRSQLKPGDLIFWNGHVAISLGGNRLVHAANPRVGVATGTIYGSPTGYRRLVG